MKKGFIVSENGNNDMMEDIYINPNEPVFTTGVVCRILRIPIWVLKQLDSEGIVCPKREKTGKSRYYSKKELSVVKHCWMYMNEKGVKIKGLKIILELEKK